VASRWTNGIVKGVLCGFVYWIFHGSLDRCLTLRSECFCLLFVKEPMKPCRTCPKRVGCESPFCCSSSLSPYRQNRVLHVCGSYWHPTDPAPNFLFIIWGAGEGGGRFNNFLCLSHNEGVSRTHSVISWIPTFTLNSPPRYPTTLRTEDLNITSYLHLLKWSLLRAIFNPGNNKFGFRDLDLSSGSLYLCIFLRQSQKCSVNHFSL
jgi:hypothetical protein